MSTAINHSLTIRPANPGDVPALWRLAALDSAPMPAEPLLVAETDGQLRVAVSISDLGAIADPFVPTAYIVELLREHIARNRAALFPQRGFRSKPALVPGLRAA